MTKRTWILALAALAVAGAARAQEPRDAGEPSAGSSSESYSLVWSVVGANGGGNAQSSGYRLQATVGQTGIGVASGLEGTAELGYWYGATGEVFADGFESGDTSAWSEAVP